MGVYDTVIVPCPKCGRKEYFQTKSGACVLKTYTLAEAPEDVMIDANRHSPHRCIRCQAWFEVDEATKTVVETSCRPRKTYL